MPSLSEQVQSNIRAITGTVGQYLEDWHALFTLAGIAVGQFNERLIAYYNSFNTGPATAASALNYFLLNPTVVTNGTIPALFAAGEQGGWWDPSDFSTMFQDSFGTTPVTAAGQPVGMILDKSGRGNHRIQSTAASRPTIQQDASGFWYLSYDGVDDFMVTGSVDFSATDKVTAWAGVNKQSDAARAKFLELGAPTATGSFGLEAPTGALPSLGFNSSGTGASFANVAAGFAAPVAVVMTGMGDIANSIATLRANGTQVATSATAQGTGTYSNAIVYFGRRGGTTLPFTGREYGTIIRGATSTAAQIATAERYMGGKMGIVL